MTVRVYRWDDAGAPVLSATIGALNALLEACLVTGYGSKAGAGWSKPFTDTNVAVFQQGAGSNGMYLRVLDNTTAATGARVVAYETMTDANTGTGAFPTEVQLAGGLYYRKSSSVDAVARPWVVVADERALYLFVGRTGDVANPFASVSWAGNFFGDVHSARESAPYATTIVGSASSTSATQVFHHLTAGAFAAASGHYIARYYTNTGESIQVAKQADPRAGTAMGIAGGVYPSPLHGGIDLAPVRLVYPNLVVEGQYPGLWCPVHNWATTTSLMGQTFAGKVGTPLEGKEFLILPTDSSSTRYVCCIEISDTWR